MDNYQGDLTDILRASGTNASLEEQQLQINWEFPSDPMNFPLDYFGDPFSTTRDPLLHELDADGRSFFSSQSGGSGMQKIIDDDTKVACNMFPQLLQISPDSELPIESPVMVASPSGFKSCTDMSLKGNLLDNSPLQISSPRNPAIKRRKSQAKKVICVPAPAAANSRPSSGEVVPSDLWAWRKYGQKPIKGSPYPRGYYRCSSSKGCSARKQVERSRSDPNMLVITYTSEHNHPWPTQRNSLAGSTRSHSSKTNAASKTSHRSQNNTANYEQNQVSGGTDNNNNNNNKNEPLIIVGNLATGSVAKEEIEKHIDMDDDDFGEGFPQSYRPEMRSYNHSFDELLFADLGEMEDDPLSVLFSQGFTDEYENHKDGNKEMDTFGMFDWSVGDINTNSNSSHSNSNQGYKRGL